MFLKNVPPVVAIHTEWRSCGPSNKSYSLPLCFNDSDSDLTSTTGTPIPQKVQMIIESLRSTQSSVDMSEEAQVEGTGQFGGQELPRQPAHKGKTGHEPRARSSTEGKPPALAAAVSEVALDGDPDSRCSDSDDSVDKGIEEAIQEYLKEKVDHKRKAEPAEPAVSPLQAPKLPRKDSTAPDVPKQQQHSDSSKVLTASNHVPKGTKGGAAQPTPTLKKRVRKKKPSKENPFKKADVSKAPAVKTPLPSEVKRGPASAPRIDQHPLVVNVEEESMDSSSDDGIEEAIQQYQLEKQESSKPLQPKEESSSDDGIEEAIRCFQQEKQKERKKSQLKPTMQGSKAAVLAADRTSTQSVKKNKLSKKKKKKKTETDVRSPLATSSTLCRSSSDSLKGGGNGVSSSVKAKEALAGQQTLSTLKVNTTAELMCAEAILDISKAVMPEAFDAGLANTGPPESTSPPPAGRTSNPSDGKSGDDDSSVDSEDGIEQEIRKFLELKAQMQKQVPASSAVPAAPTVPAAEPAVTKEPQSKELDASPNKTLRLSLSRKRKRKEEGRKVGKGERTDQKVKEEPLKKPLAQNDILRAQASGAISEPSAAAADATAVTNSSVLEKHGKPNQPSVNQRDVDGLGTSDSSPSTSSPRNALRSPVCSERREHGGEKSSSLDSDEDLDAAIKDLLKTKKKLKKKVRDVKLKARKGLKPAETSTAEAPRKHRLSTEHKSDAAAKATKASLLKSGKDVNSQTKTDRGEKHNVHRSSSSELPPSATRAKAASQSAETGKAKGNGGKSGADSRPGSNIPASPRVEEDSSSVDSDDSIEQEIQRFLAEKARVSTTMVSVKEEEDLGKGVVAKDTCPSAEEGVKLEDQQAEIPKNVGTPQSDRVQIGRPEQEACHQDNDTSTSQPVGCADDAPASTNKGPPFTFTPAGSSHPGYHSDKPGSCGARGERRQRRSSGRGDTQDGSSEATTGKHRPHHRASPDPPKSHTPRQRDSPTPLHSHTPRMRDSPGPLHSHGHTHTTGLRSDPYAPSHRASHTPPHSQTMGLRPSDPHATPPAGAEVEPRPPSPLPNPPPHTSKTNPPSNPGVGEIRRAAPMDACGVTGSHQSRSRVGAPPPPREPPPSASYPSTSAASPVANPSSRCSTETPVILVARGDRITAPTPTASRSGGFFMHGRAKRGRWDQPPLLPPPPHRAPGSSVVHMRKDQAAFVELSAHKTNHLQVRNRQAREGEERRERVGERERERVSVRREEEEQKGGEEEEECIDETDLESDEEAGARPRQELSGFSSCIDPGIHLSPYIALDTEQRSRKFQSRLALIKQQQITKIKRGVKRKLQFVVSVPRKRDAFGN